MDKLFLDANVVVDFLCERSDDFYLPAARLMVKSYNKEDFQNAQLPVYTPKEYLEMFCV